MQFFLYFEICSIVRSCITARILSSSTSAAHISPLHRFPSAAAAAPAVSPNPSFAVAAYLVETCGLTRPQAVKGAAMLSHLKSPSNPNAVLAFLAGLGLSGADVAAVVATDPRFLCANVHKTLSPVVVGLTGCGLSRSEIGRLVSRSPSRFRSRSIVSGHLHPPSTNLSFDVEQYLVDTCGLTRPQAIKGAAKLSHLKSPSNPDAVLAGLGLSGADVTAVVTTDPRFLCVNVHKTLSPVVVGLTGLGLSRSEIARLAWSIVSNLPCYLHLFGSYEDLLPVLKRSLYLLSCDLERVVKPNVAFLRECGLSACDVAKLCGRLPSILTANLERIQVMVVRAEELGVPRGSGMFRQILRAVALVSEEKIAAQVVYLKKTFSWSDVDVRIAVCKAPMLLLSSEDMLQRRSEFLIHEVGLEPPYIARRPAVISYSLEGRLRPRYYVMKFLKANGLLDDRDYFTTVTYSEKLFVEKYICPHKEAAPHLAEDYEAACSDQVPNRFIFS